MKKPQMEPGVEEALERAGSVVSEDVLRRLRDKIAEVRVLDFQIAEAEERLEELKRKRYGIVGHFRISGQLVEMFQSAGVKTLSITASGNLPSYDAKLVQIYHAKLPEDDRRAKAFKKFRWLSGLSKTSFRVDFAKGQDKLVKNFQSLLKKQKIRDYEVKVGVHSSTLTAEIRRRFVDGQPLSPADMDLLGAAVFPVVELKQQGEVDDGKGKRDKRKN